MADPLGDRDQAPGGKGKRPVPTIEGTATEVSVEPSGEPSTMSAEADEASGDTEEAQAALAGPEETAETERTAKGEKPPVPPRATVSELKSFVTHLAAGMLGGLIGVIGLAFAWNLLPSSGKGDGGANISKLEQRVTRLEAAPQPGDDGAALAALEDRVKAVEDRDPEAPPEIAELKDRVGQLETSLKAMADAAKDGGSVEDAAAISQQIGEAEQRLQAKIDAALAASKDAAGPALQDMQKEIAALKAKLGALAEAGFDSADGAELKPEVTALAERLAKLESALPKLASIMEQEAAETKSATVAIAFANLQAAIGAGRPFASELDTLGALSPSVGDLGILLAHAEKGIPTLPELTRSFEAAKDAALAAAAPASDGSFLDSLLASAQDLVKIRRVDEAATGDAPSAVLARAEAQLDKGNLAESVNEVESLDQAPRDAFSRWLDQAHARLIADETLRRLEGILLVSISAPLEAPERPVQEDDE